MPDSADLLSRVRRVEITTRRAVNDMMVGAYHSQFKGRGLDFEELREYIPGDDVRSIDWNVTARMRRPFVKNYREERELTTWLVVDVSASGEFGSQRVSKREFAAEVAATLAVSALKNGDKVGLLLFTDEAELLVKPKKGRRHLLRIIRELLAFEPRHRRTDIQNALVYFNHVAKRRAIVFLVTDFLHSMGRSSATGRELFDEIGQTNVRHDLVAMHLHDPRETELPDAGVITLEDSETGAIYTLDAARPSLRSAYAREAEARLASLDRSLAESGVDTLRLSAGEQFAPRLQRFFEQRRRR
ncbi:MAG: DUF58 domain-containing protein [Chthoniobacteraceae bacterium]